MALNPSGPIRLGGSTTGESVNLELGRTATYTTSLGESDVRSIAGVLSGAISLSDLRGKGRNLPFMMAINSDQTADDNFTFAIVDSLTNTSTSLSGTANFSYAAEGSVYMWLWPGQTQASFLALPGVSSIISTYVASPVYRGSYTLPALPIAGQPLRKIVATNVQDNVVNNSFTVVHGFTSPLAVTHAAVLISGTLPGSVQVNVTWGQI